MTDDRRWTGNGDQKIALCARQRIHAFGEVRQSPLHLLSEYPTGGAGRAAE
jgi:hypothetical protein